MSPYKKENNRKNVSSEELREKTLDIFAELIAKPQTRKSEVSLNWELFLDFVHISLCWINI